MSTLPDHISPITSRPVSAKNLRDIEVAELTIKKLKLTSQIDDWSQKFMSDYSTLPTKYDRDTDPVISEIYQELKKVTAILKDPQAGIIGTPPKRPDSSISSLNSVHAPLNEKKIEEKSTSSSFTSLPVVTPNKEYSMDVIKDIQSSNSMTSQASVMPPLATPLETPLAISEATSEGRDSEIAVLTKKKLLLTKQVDDWASDFTKGIDIYNI